ncbi:S8 family serine peptidase [Bacillus capparidis]|uniref:Subtilisin family serine protease n=1 Tax=Bacillus capparidis TaxID=1840411 RepID=A0ABS4CVQ6_9BACI|nr:subtilisin family serine protease [Bacillus capparidis]MED1096092.1 S8 family serine peptidase [Bacillus capparidis]
MKKSICILSILFLFINIQTTYAEADDRSSDIRKTQIDGLFDEEKDFSQRELVIKFEPSIKEEEKSQILANYHLSEQTYNENGGFSLVSASPESELKGTAERLRNDKRVQFVEPNFVIESAYVPQEPGYSHQWSLKKINMEKAWDITKGSSDITVAVIDGGLQSDHPDLKGNVLPSYNAVTGGKTITADKHGTHVAGIIAASLNKLGITGIAPNVKILPIDVFEGKEANAYDVADAIIYAADHGANVINLSLSTTNYAQVMEEAIHYARSKGIVTVASAGNDGSDVPEYPAALDSVISVSSTNSQDAHSNFSNYGPEIDISAPGEGIYSTVTGSKYGTMNGTSMAAPAISGTAALILSKNPLLSADKVTSILMKSTIDLGEKGKDILFGNGRIDVDKAMKNTPLPVDRLDGASRYEVAANVSKKGWSTANTVVIANGSAYADVLAAAPLAYHHNAPILLTENNKLTGSTKERMTQLKAKKAIIIGGSLSVQDNVANEIKKLVGTVERIGGDSRYQVAENIAGKLPGQSKAVIANGTAYADSLAIASYAAKNKIPILLTTSESLPEPTANALRNKGTSSTIVVGGKISVGENVYQQLPSPTRIGGNSRFEVASHIAKNYFSTSNEAFISNGYAYADALSGSVLAAKQNRPMMFTDARSLPNATNEVITSNKMKGFTVLGGKKSVSDQVVRQLETFEIPQ